MSRQRTKGDGLYRDPRSPNWQIDKEFAGRRLRRSAGTPDYGKAKDQVDAWVAAIKREQLREQLGEKPNTGKDEISINDAATKYFDEIGTRAKSSDQVDFQLAWIVENINPRGNKGATLLSAINETIILELCAIRRAQGRLGADKKWRACSEHTINRAVLDPLRSMMRRATITWKAHVATIDWNGIYTPRTKEGRATSEMSASKETELFAELRDDAHELVEFLFIHGIRSDRAVRNMQHDHVDFDAGTFKVLKKTRQLGEHYQEVPMTARSRALLLAQRGRHPKFVWTYVVHRAHATPGGKRCRKGDRRPMTKTVLRGLLKRALKAIGMEKFRPHDIRHTMARRTLRTTKNLRLVQHALGHAEITTTAIYADVLIDDVRAGLEETASAHPRKSPGEASLVPRETYDLEGKKRA